jgi:signal transduction histidine kinase
MILPRRHGYPGPMEWAYTWPRRHRQLVDGALAALLLAGRTAATDARAAALLITITMAGAIAVRRRFPVAAFAAAIVVCAVAMAIGRGPEAVDSPSQPALTEIATLLLLYTVAANLPRRVSLPSLAACVLCFTAEVAWWAPRALEQGSNPVPVLLAPGFLLLLAAVSAWVLGDSMAFRRAYSAGLEERAIRAERERDAHAQIAAAAERARIARELHDVIAHNLSVMVAQADGGRYVFDAAPEQSRQALAEIGDTGRQALAEMSNLVGVLRNGDEMLAFAPAPGIAEIAELLTQARESGTGVGYDVQGVARPLTAGLSLTVYRIVQEALTNVRKHAGHGAAVEVTLSYGADDLLVRIADDGSSGAAVSQPADTTGHGLAGMRERAAMYGGTVQAGPRPGGGFQVTAELPLRARDAA